MLPDFMRLGNVLYQWLWAYRGQRDGLDRVCLANADTLKWLPVFPDVRCGLVVLPHEVRLRDQRVRPWLDEKTHPARFESPHLDEFCRDMLLPGLAAEVGPSDRLVVNVRRGDYYSVPEHEREFGFDVVEFVRQAVRASIAEAGRPSEIQIVSDHPEWCTTSMPFLDDIAPVTRASGTADPANDFRAVVSARRLILANSTFSYGRDTQATY